ncbi:MAG: amino acid adenylation domain-containing protein [Pirellulaceae bacterium]
MATDTPKSEQGSSPQQDSSLQHLTPEQQRELLAKLLRERSSKPNTYPMSAGQQGLWHAYRRDPNAVNFNVFLPTRIRSEFDLEALSKSIDWLTSRHGSLRTTFSDEHGELTQTSHAKLAPGFQIVPMPGATDDQLRAKALTYAQQPFDLEKGPLLRIIVFKVAEQDHLVLALTHHIVVDFWSLVLILSELRQAYAAFACQTQPVLPPATDNYRSFVQNQSRWLESPASQPCRDYWQDLTADSSPVVEIPADFLRPTSFTGKAANSGLVFPPDIGQRISKFAAACRTTPATVIQAAVQALVGTYSGEEKFFTGNPFSGRLEEQFEKSVGFFVNILPIQANLSGRPSFNDLVRRSSAKMLEALENEAYPIARIVQDAKTARDPSRSPLFQVSCTFEKSHLRGESGRASFLFPGEKQSWNFSGLRQESFFVPVETCHYDLEFIFEYGANHLQGMLCYCSDLFSAQSMKQLGTNFVELFDTLLSNPDAPLESIAWERFRSTRTLTYLRPATVTADEDEPKHLTLCDLFNSATAKLKSPETKIAIRHKGQSLTYADFELQAENLAEAFPEPSKPVQSTRSAAGTDEHLSLIPVIGSREPEVFPAMFAVLRSGRAMVPVDTGQPALPISELTKELKTEFVVTSDSARAALERLDGPLPPQFSIDSNLRTSSASSANQTSNHLTKNPIQDVAYMVYTSGSTGKPKGVLVEHAAILNTLHWRSKAIPLTEGDNVLLLLSHQFDAGLAIAWTTYAQGATLVMAEEEDLRDPGRIIDLMLREQVTVLPAPPSLLEVILSHPRFPECAANLKYIWTGGEAMPSELPERIRQLTSAKFVNFYGPTEAAIEATFYDASKHEVNRPVPIGQPVDGMEILIVDGAAQEVPDTVPGELAIAGPGLALGYWQDPQQTARKFVLHPYDSNRRMYLTGDRARRNPEGQIEFFGRIDHQVKLRGYRIELGEIESHIDSHPAITRSAALVHGENSSSASLIAFVTVHEDYQRAEKSGLVNDLRRSLAKQLPPYKCPVQFYILDEMPITTSGKVDRKRLPSVSELTVEQVQLTQPATVLESFLAEAWQKILEHESIGTNQNFFEAGGSSLQAAMLTSELSEELGVEIPTNLLFDLADIQQLACRLVELHPGAMSQRFGEDCIALQLEQRALTAARLGTNYHPLIAPLRATGNVAPLFMVHPPGGIVVCYRELMNCLPESQPVFGIRSRGLHGKEDLPSSLEAMAAEYIEAIRSVQPDGPFVLGGWSLGGLVAYEMAQQLTASGESVQSLLLLDTSIPDGASDIVPQSDTVDVGREYGIDLSLDELAKLEPDEQLPFLWEHAKKLGVLEENSAPEVVAKALSDLQHLFHHHISLASDYKILPLQLPLTLFRPTERPEIVGTSDDRGWSHLCRQVDVHWVPGHHHSMVQPPNVAKLADEMLGYLDR